MLRYKNANEAYLKTLEKIEKEGTVLENTICLFNHGFYIENPIDNVITDFKRKWKKEYADYEWDWYKSKNPNALDIAKRAKIWLNHVDNNGNVNSNYGSQLFRNGQIEYVLKKIKANKFTRHCWLTIYDCKDHSSSPFTNNGFDKDTPCTLSIGFQYYNDKLNMTVLMRSNDIRFGFCNDQYCFSKFFELVCRFTNLPIGEYYHFSSNLHKYIK
jgi:thymidylate synthase